MNFKLCLYLCDVHFSDANCVNDISGEQSNLTVTSYILRENYSNKSFHKAQKYKKYMKI